MSTCSYRRALSLLCWSLSQQHGTSRGCKRAHILTRHLSSSRPAFTERERQQCVRPFFPTLQGRRLVVPVMEGMSVRELAKHLKISPLTLCRLPEFRAEKITANSKLSMELAELAVLEYGHTAHIPRVRDPQRMASRDQQLLQRCPPVVTVMGHVDHGKTTLLDSLRKTAVAAGEAGGITQHIGAFSVPLGSGDRITFLDTPGHAAFSAMRARGANVTDIAVLVVAADDGVKPQTQECIQLTQQAGVPIVVAINKCDKPQVDVEKVKHQLLHNGVQLEQFGGDVQAVEISAVQGTGLVALEEAILAQAELSNIRADFTGRVEGVVLEVKSDRGLGSVATVLVQHGELKRGQVLVAGEVWGKIRTLLSDSGKPVERAGPSTPVLTAGWRQPPMGGELCLQVENEGRARELINQRVLLRKKKDLMARKKEAVCHNSTDKKPVVPLVVKGDVAGSVEALLGILTSKQPEQFELEVVLSGVGPISDSDVEMAISVGGVVLGFSVSAVKTAAQLAKQRQVTVLTHNVIYKLLEELRDSLQDKLPSVVEEVVVGEAAVLKTFKLTGARAALVGGCRVKKGQLVRDGIYRLLRDGEVVHEGRLSGMMRAKEEITTAKKETECGISFTANGVQFQEGDWVQCIKKNRVAQTLQWHLGF